MMFISLLGSCLSDFMSWERGFYRRFLQNPYLERLASDLSDIRAICISKCSWDWPMTRPCFSTRPPLARARLTPSLALVSKQNMDVNIVTASPPPPSITQISDVLLILSCVNFETTHKAVNCVQRVYSQAGRDKQNLICSSQIFVGFSGISMSKQYFSNELTNSVLNKSLRTFFYRNT